jgi:flagellar hook protein FlgE
VDGNTPAVTQYAEASAISATKQDGSSAAQPVSVRLGTNGVIVAQYSNGKTVPVAQIALATILNPDSMEAAGNNLFLLGSESAPPAIGAPGTGGRGLIIEGALEGSTVDIATEFTNLMQFQRSYQASSKVITTMDEMTQDVISIKR